MNVRIDKKLHMTLLNIIDTVDQNEEQLKDLIKKSIFEDGNDLSLAMNYNEICFENNWVVSTKQITTNETLICEDGINSLDIWR